MSRGWVSSTILMSVMIASVAPDACAEGWYGRADFGDGVDGALKFEQSISAFGGDAGVESDSVVSGAAGYQFANGLRLEAEVAHSSGAVTQPECGSQVCLAVVESFSGEQSAWTAMLNGVYEFNQDGVARPFVGLGVGAAQVSTDIIVGAIAANAIDEDATAFAYQAVAGVAAPVAENTAIELGYRYFAAPGLELGSREAEYTRQAVTVGVRHSF